MSGAVQKGKPVTGTPGQVETTIKKKVSQFASQNSAIYVGKTSGRSGLQERYNNKYKDQRFDSIVPIYKTSSAANARKVEALAIEHAKAGYGKKVKNAVAGGGGPDGNGATKSSVRRY